MMKSLIGTLLTSEAGSGVGVNVGVGVVVGVGVFVGVAVGVDVSVGVEVEGRVDVAEGTNDEVADGIAVISNGFSDSAAVPVCPQPASNPTANVSSKKMNRCK